MIGWSGSPLFADKDRPWFPQLQRYWSWGSETEAMARLVHELCPAPTIELLVALSFNGSKYFDGTSGGRTQPR